MIVAVVVNLTNHRFIIKPFQNEHNILNKYFKLIQQTAGLTCLIKSLFVLFIINTFPTLCSKMSIVQIMLSNLDVCFNNNNVINLLISTFFFIRCIKVGKMISTTSFKLGTHDQNCCQKTYCVSVTPSLFY